MKLTVQQVIEMLSNEQIKTIVDKALIDSDQSIQNYINKELQKKIKSVANDAIEEKVIKYIKEELKENNVKNRVDEIINGTLNDSKNIETIKKEVIKVIKNKISYNF